MDLDIACWQTLAKQHISKNKTRPGELFYTFYSRYYQRSMRNKTIVKRSFFHHECIITLGNCHKGTIQ